MSILTFIHRAFMPNAAWQAVDKMSRSIALLDAGYYDNARRSLTEAEAEFQSAMSAYRATRLGRIITWLAGIQ